MSNLEDRVESDSDCSDDEDYVPEGELNDLSEESKSGDEEEGAENSDNDAEPGQKRSKNKKIKKSRKRAKVEESDGKDEDDSAAKAVCEEEAKKRAEDIWAAFKMETGGVVSKKQDNEESSSKTTAPRPEPSKCDSNQEKEPEKPKLFEFAGETHVLTGPSTLKPVEQAAPSRGPQLVGRRNAGGLAGILSQIKGKGTKLSTLEKSKMDWQNFKAQQGIEEEIQTHNRGKQGYLERQDFLERADLRRFEIEKQMRATARRSNH